MISFSLALLLLSAAPASQEDATRKAKAAFESASKFYKSARYADAVKKFEEAYSLKPHPSIFFNIGKCHEQLGDPARALRNYRDYLRLSPNAPDVSAVSDSIATLERRLKDKGVQQLLVLAEPREARIEIDGKDLGVSPASVELPAGSHKMVVRAEGFETVEKSFVMSTAHVDQQEVTLQVAAVAKNESKPTVSDAPKTDERTLIPNEKPTENGLTALESAPKKKPRVFTWVTAGLAAAAGGTGAIFGVMNLNTQKALGTPAPGRDVNALNEQLKQQATVANACFIGAGVAGAAAIVLFFVEGN
jgi:tetratricopeptide (TPR) repeat protein